MAFVSLHEYQFFLSSIYQGLPSSFDAFLNKYETSGTRLNMFANGGKPLEIAIRSGNTVMLRKLFVHSSPHFQNLGAEPCVDDGDEVAGDDDEENDEEVDVESLHCSMKRRDMLLIFRRVVNDWDQYIDVGTTCAMWLRRSLTPSSRRRMWCGIRPPLLPAASRPLVLQTRHCQILELLQGSQSPKPKPMIYKLSINCHVGKLTRDFHFSAAKSFFLLSERFVFKTQC